ncbi:MAG: RluA family pseudouridine synthase [Paludibacteraceae bacterium]|nr:RluA family pseudouridine synthase [Paludibacteraceae bacterium]
MQTSVKQFSVRVDEDGLLMEFLLRKLNGYSRTAVKSLLAHRQVWLNDAMVLSRHDDAVKKGDKISIRSSKGMMRQRLEHPLLKVVYEDDAVIVVDKGYGLLSVGTDKEKEKTAYHLLNMYMKQLGPKYRIFVVHRLDRDTSGLMVFAKTQEAQEKLQANWNDMVIERSYVAVVEGVVPDDEGVIKSYLTEDKQLRMHASDKDNGGQYAETHYEVMHRGKAYTMLKLDLATGRKNQIRVQLQSIGFPISGDKKYGGKTSPAKRLCLHAATLKFTHPVTGRPLSFTLPTPSAFQYMMK